MCSLCLYSDRFLTLEEERRETITSCWIIDMDNRYAAAVLQYVCCRTKQQQKDEGNDLQVNRISQQLFSASYHVATPGHLLKRYPQQERNDYEKGMIVSLSVTHREYDSQGDNDSSNRSTRLICWSNFPCPPKPHTEQNVWRFRRSKLNRYRNISQSLTA